MYYDQSVYLCCSCIACVASVSVGFQSRESFDNFVVQEMETSEKMERGGKGEGGGGKGMKEMLASKGRYFAKHPQVVSVATCRLVALQWPRHLVISSQSKSDQNKQSDADASESNARFCGFSEQRKTKVLWSFSVMNIHRNACCASYC